MIHDASLDESIAAARSDVDRDATNHQLDAFHRTFSFCLSCRQYTCANCWNETEARCLSCAPLAIPETLGVADFAVDPDRLLRFVGGQPEHEHKHAHEQVHVPELDAPLVGAGVESTGPDPDSIMAGPREPLAPEIEPLRVDDPVEATQPPEASLGGLAVGQTLNDAIAAYEATLDHDAALDGLAAEPAIEASATEPTPVVALEPQPEPEPITAAVDSVVQPVWPVPTHEPAAPPQWPTGPRWPTGVPARTAAAPEATPVDALAALIARRSTDEMWAASSREMLQPVAAVPYAAAVQSCGNCGLSLSANARFCRRCGTSQG